MFLGGAGAFVAVIAEVAAKEDVSITLKVRETITMLLEVQTEPVFVILFFVLLGAVVTFISQTVNLAKAFYTGASVLTILMTVIPTGLPASPGGVVVNADDDAAVIRRFGDPNIRLASYSHAKTTQIGRAQPAVFVTVTDKKGRVLSDIRMTLRTQSGKIISKARYRSGSFRFTQRPGSYLMVIDVPGYKWQKRVIKLRPGSKEKLRFAMDTTWQPLVIQRQFRSF